MGREDPHRPGDVELARLDLDERPEPRAVHLPRAGRQPFEDHLQPAVRVAAVVLEDDGLAAGLEDEVEVAVVVDIERDHPRGGRHPRRQDRPRLEGGRARPAERGRPFLARDDEVREAVVVEVGEEERPDSELAGPGQVRALLADEAPVPLVDEDDEPLRRRDDEVQRPVRVQIVGRQGAGKNAANQYGHASPIFPSFHQRFHQ